MNAFNRELERVRNRWRLGLAGSALLDLAVGSAVALALLGAADFVLALDPGWRLALSSAAAVGLLAFTLVRLGRIARLHSRDAAVYADHLLKNTRQDVLAAWELQRTVDPEATPLAGFFLAACVRQAAGRLGALVNPFPAAAWRTGRRRAGWTLGTLSVAALLMPRIAGLECGRILTPFADIPPYSRYRFEVSPPAPQVVYGRDLVVGVEVTGAPVAGPVLFVTRQAGRMLETPCFQGSSTRFAQRLERVMQPVDFCFKVGRARSTWRRVEVLLEPQIEGVHVRLAPPAYSRLPERQFELGTEPLSGLKNSRVELTVRSNRPLQEGSLTHTPLDGISQARIVAGVKTNSRELVFAWTVEQDAKLSLTIRDHLGTPVREPMKIAQRVIADEPPRIALHEPAVFSLATPRVAVSVGASVQDDLGLRSADLFRGVMGYRSRGERADLDAFALIGEVTGRLDLARLGVEPGQVLELLVEAMDTNPELTGLGASDVARILIISDEEYAAMEREKTTLEAFQERFRGVAENLRELREALKAARAAVKDGKLDPAAQERLMKEMESAMAGTAEGLKELAGQFAAFDLEKKLAAAARELAEPFAGALAHPGWKANDSALRLAALEASLAAVGAGEEAVGQAAEDAEDAVEVARVMACATWFRALLDRQDLLVRRLERAAAGERDVIDPGVLARTQDAIRDELEKLTIELDAAASALPDEYAVLRTSALDFLYALRDLEIPQPMTECAAASRNNQMRAAWSHGNRVLEKMRELLSKGAGGSGFGGMCNGELRFQVPEDLGGTLAQMMQALMKQYADGVGRGMIGAAGLGVSGTTEGSPSDGYSARNIPVYGPSRTNPFQAEGHGPKGDGVGAGEGKALAKRVADGSTLKGDNTRRVSGSGVNVESVPIRYRDAVKRFYSEEQP